jgi:hypothetical protein
MVSARRPQSLLFPLLLVVVGVVAAVGLAVEGGREAWIPVPLLSVVLGVLLMLQPGETHVELSAPVGVLEHARCELLAGSAELQVRSHELGPDLYRAGLSFPGREPHVALDRDQGVLRIDLPRPWWRSLLPQANAERAVVVLNSRVRWSLEVRADAVGGRLDLSHATLAGLVVTAGRGELHVDLPAPHGTVPVALSGSGMRALLSLPAEVPVQLSCEQGGWHVETPEQRGAQAARRGRHTVISGDHELTANRYDVTLTGPAGQVVVERR